MTDAERRRRVEHVCDAALDRDPRERGAFVVAACGGDEALRQEVEALLTHAQTAEGFLAAPIGAVAAHVLGEEPVASLVGRQVGVYHIGSHLGTGGMGEVYRARDTRLGREVAIKFLPRAFKDDPDRLVRFEREARVLASLNHPHIGAIYGLEEADGVRALVLELVEGETLSDRVARGPLPLSDGLTIARQVADALEAAHERGIIHRDLKPANIKIAPDDVVKVLDFGLAKAMTGDAFGSDLSQSPTVTLVGTREGMILGTAAYMSPEQARGQPVDKRTDIWAFGCVLYEMLTGRVTFAATTMSDTIAAILEHQPDWAALPTFTPLPIDRLLRRCLEKDVKKRLRDIGDARFELDEALTSHTRPMAASVSAPPRQVHFKRLTDFVGINESPALSPDGKMLAFVSLVAGRRQIWIRLLAGGVPLQITHGDADHEQPRWTPDSSAIVYYSPSAIPGVNGTVWEVAALGGAPRPIVSANGPGDISHDGQRIAVFQFLNGRMELIVAARDGSGVECVAAGQGAVACGYPRWSPDDRWIAYQSHPVDYFDQRINVVSAAGGEPCEVARETILRGISWLPDGSGLVFSSSAGSTVAYPPTFNLRAVDRDGSGHRQLTYGDASYVEPEVHASGRLVVCRVRAQSDIWRFPVTGSPSENTQNGTRITRQTGQVQTPSVSPDGRELVYLSDTGGHGNLWVARSDGSSVRQITFESDDSVGVGVPAWSPAGNRIVFMITREGQNQFWLVHPDGSGLRQLPVGGRFACWSGDGQWLYYTPVAYPERIEKILVSGGAAVVVRGDHALAAAVDPDGHALYYATELRSEIGSSGDWQIWRAEPEDGPSQPLARIAGFRIPVSPRLIHYFVSPNGKSLAMPLTDSGTTNLWALPTDGGPMRPLTAFGERPVVIARRISWSPDGLCLYAAVAEIAADIVLLDGLLPLS